MAVFAFVDGEMNVLLVRRRYEPYQSYWALPGGLLDRGRRWRRRPCASCAEETGVTDMYIEQLATFSDVDRDPRGRVVSCCYLALVDGGRVRLRHPGRTSREAVWRPLEPLLRRDRRRRDACSRSTTTASSPTPGSGWPTKLEYQNVAWSLLPERFTMTRAAAGVRERDRPRIRAEQLPADRAWAGACWPRAGERATGGRPAALYRFAERAR